MKCPFCGHPKDKVVDSRESGNGDAIRRRRECLECGRRFTSYERIEEIPYLVIKKDGRREAFDRQKLMAGLLRACEKRPVSAKPERHLAAVLAKINFRVFWYRNMPRPLLRLAGLVWPRRSIDRSLTKAVNDSAIFKRT